MTGGIDTQGHRSRQFTAIGPAAATLNHCRADGCRYQALSDLHLRVRPVAVLRHRRRGRPGRDVDQAWAVRHRIFCGFRQHVPALSGRPPYVVRASAVDRGCAGADAAPVRRCLPQLIDLVIKGAINPGKVFDLTLPLDQVAEGYRAMGERRAIKTLLCP
jgi:hypothetical protein